MKLSRALLLSVIVTLALTLLLQLLFGAMAFGLFLFLPLSFFFSSNRFRRPRPPQGPGSTPIEPR